MKMHLVVVRPFRGYARGDVIADQKLMSDVLGSENARYVVRVVTPAPKGG